MQFVEIWYDILAVLENIKDILYLITFLLLLHLIYQASISRNTGIRKAKDVYAEKKPFILKRIYRRLRPKVELGKGDKKEAHE